MATVTYIKETRQHLSAMRAVMAYCMREDKTWDEQSGQQLISGINCEGRNSILEFEATKAAHGKTDGINFYQYVQFAVGIFGGEELRDGIQSVAADAADIPLAGELIYGFAFL